MLSLGWSEVTIIFVIVIIVVGPKELPQLLKQFGTIIKKFRSISKDFNTSINNIIKESDIENSIQNKTSDNIKDKIKSEFDDINSSFKKLKNNINDFDKKNNKK